MWPQHVAEGGGAGQGGTGSDGGGIGPSVWAQTSLAGSATPHPATMTADAPKKSNWWDAFPEPRHTAPLLPREAVDLTSRDLLLVDVRRTDFEGGTIKGSLNLPAHSFYLNRAVLYDLCKRAGVKQVAFYCGTSAFIVVILPWVAVSRLQTTAHGSRVA